MNNTTSLYNVPSSPTERFLLAVWCLVVMATSLLGNSFLLLSSLKYKAIRIDKVTLALIEMIAVADIGYACYVFSTFVSIVANRYSSFAKLEKCALLRKVIL